MHIFSDFKFCYRVMIVIILIAARAVRGARAYKELLECFFLRKLRQEQSVNLELNQS